MNRRRVVIAGGTALAAAAIVGLYRFHGSSDGTATLPATAGSAVPVTTAVAQSEDFAIRRRTIGILESPAIVVVKSRIDSQVTEQHVKDGQLVKKGDLLLTLDDREVKATLARDEAQLAKDEANVLRTQVDLDRYQRLATTNAVPLQQLDQAVADHKIALAVVDADKAQLRADNLKLDYITIEAPISGRTGTVRVTPGNLVSINDPLGLVTITQIRPIRVNFTLAERDLGALRKASIAKPAAVVRVYSPGTSEPLAVGELDFIDSAVDTASGTITAKARFANDNFALWPGMYVDVEIDLAMRSRTIMIPAVAVQSGQDGPFVFVVRPDKKVEMRKVEFVAVEGNRVALALGVSAGEQVVVEGQMRLVDGAAVDAVAPAGAKAAANAGAAAITATTRPSR